MIKRKAININEELCNGYSNCTPDCPEGAIRITDGKDSEKDKNTVRTSSEICPGSRTSDFGGKEKTHKVKPGIWKTPLSEKPEDEIMKKTQLKNWPIKIKLVPPNTPFLQNSSILIAADCVPFTHPDFHEKFLKRKVLLAGCPKFDDVQFYLQRISDIVSNNNIKSITVVYMEVLCCFSLISVVQEAIKRSGKIIPFAAIKINTRGEII